MAKKKTIKSKSTSNSSGAGIRKKTAKSGTGKTKAHKANSKNVSVEGRKARYNTPKTRVKKKK